MATQKEHIDTEGNHCPKCGSDQIEGESIEVDGKIASQQMQCFNDDCDANWIDEYTLTGFRML